MELPTATTLNGAISHVTSSDARVNFFFKITRDLTAPVLEEFLAAAWEENPLDTLKLIFHLRDCRGGKGEKKQFQNALRWLVENHRDALLINLKNVPEFGYYKDLLTLGDTTAEGPALRILADRLEQDKKLLTEGEDLTSISLAAKWAPTEGCFHDKKFNATSKLSTMMNLRKVHYRKNVIVPLRNHLRIVERKMCDGDWENIDFAKVPSVAMKRYAKIFKKHSPERYQAFLAAVKKGQTKMNVGRLHPHEIVGQYLKDGVEPQREVDEMVEVQWSEYLRQLKERIQLKGSLAVVDVSGSMSGTPIKVAMSLGLVLAELTEGPFHNKWITFSNKPTLEQLKGTTLHEQLQNMSQASWDMNTDLQAVFTLLLISAEVFSCTQEQMPKTIFIFSDMQFDKACKNKRTNFEAIERKYEKAGYQMPRLVFWNIKSDNLDFPVKADTPHVALVSGFSPDLLELFLDGDDLTPYGYMRKAIDNKRYDCITLQ